MRRNIFASLFFCLLLGASQASLAQTTVYMKPEEAIKFIFKDSQEVYQEKHSLTEEQRKQAKALLGYDLPKNDYAFYIGKSSGKIDAYALIDEQIGKVLPITFISRINSQGQIDEVEIMVYRESHGGEVKSRRFLNQFKKKTLNDELRLQGDIVNVTGATLSSRALVVGTKRALVLWKIFYGH